MAAAGSGFDARDFTWVAQLPAVWDGVRAYRERSLNGMNLLRGIVLQAYGPDPVVVGNLECCKVNSDILATILKIMGDVGCIFVPRVFLLQGACLEFHCNAGYPEALSLGGAAYSDGWGLKRMLGFLKRKWMRDQKPRDRTIRKLVAEFDRAFKKLGQAVGDRIARALRARGEDDDDDEDPQAEVDSDRPRAAENPDSKEMVPGNASVSVELPEEMAPTSAVPEQAPVNPEVMPHEEAAPLLPRQPTREDLEKELRIAELKLEAKRL
ncbi:unnamed protein product [Symbiodinium necroappetens]|uniref:Uncharacterized protein n=1 Tax=Symbiodinium necroappetens TaxID=1628268 RepID=A0A812NFL6_9DINO|nr:unnamed protein product [Symbiodinium necroappetens]